MTLSAGASPQKRRTEIRALDKSINQTDLLRVASGCLKRSRSISEAIAEMVNLALDDKDVLEALVTEYFMVVVSAANTTATREKAVAPLRVPSSDDLRAALNTRQSMATSLMDAMMIDRKPIGDWTIGECRAAAVGKLREGHILNRIGQKFTNVDPKVRVRDAIKVEDLQKIVKEAGSTVSETFKGRSQSQ